MTEQHEDQNKKPVKRWRRSKRRQPRRSVSMRGDTYRKLKHSADANNLSVCAFVEKWIATLPDHDGEG